MCGCILAEHGRHRRLVGIATSAILQDSCNQHCFNALPPAHCSLRNGSCMRFAKDQRNRATFQHMFIYQTNSPSQQATTMALWSSGMIRPSGGRGPEFDSRKSPFGLRLFGSIQYVNLSVCGSQSISLKLPIFRLLSPSQRWMPASLLSDNFLGFLDVVQLGRRCRNMSGGLSAKRRITCLYKLQISVSPEKWY